jgi:uncharacterized protein YaeQ/TfoX/Sxy family transcriptional regulator of competence genes
MHEFLEDRLRKLPELEIRAMFGGAGIYADGAMFGIAHGGRVYFKTSPASRTAFVELGMKPFRPPRGAVLKSYYEVPPGVVDDEAELVTWARKALASAAAPSRSTKARTVAPAEILERHSSGVRELAERLRKVVLEEAPEAEEAPHRVPVTPLLLFRGSAGGPRAPGFRARGSARGSRRLARTDGQAGPLRALHAWSRAAAAGHPVTHSSGFEATSAEPSRPVVAIEVASRQRCNLAPLALTATLYHWKIALSDVERGVYEALDLRLAQHPSENARYLVTRALAYALSYEEGIAFSKGGVSSTDEPPVIVRDPTGILLAWIEIGSPSAARLHKASKAARRVALFTSADIASLREEAGSIHHAESIEVWELEASFLDAIGERLERTLALEVVHTGEQLYVTVGGEVLEGSVTRSMLRPEAG